MTTRRNDPRFGPDGPSTPPEPDRGAAGGPEGAAPRDGEDLGAVLGEARPMLGRVVAR